MDYDQDWQEKRQFPRRSFKHPVRYALESEEYEQAHLACDLSKGGIRMHLNEFVAVGSTVRITLGGHKELPVELKGHVVWVEYLPYADRYQAGIEFAGENLTREKTARIEQLSRLN